MNAEKLRKELIENREILEKDCARLKPGKQRSYLYGMKQAYGIILQNVEDGRY